MRLLLFLLSAVVALAQTQVDGTAIDALTGQPLAGVHVILRTPQKRYGAMTAADGHFSVVALPPDTYSLTAGKNSYVGPEPVTISLQSGDHKRDLELKMVPAGSISGRVLDSDGDPADGVFLTAIRGEPAGYGTTNDDGEFRIEDLRPGRYLLQTGRSGAALRPEIRSDGTQEVNYGPTYYPGVLDAASAVPIEVKAGAEVAGIEIRLAQQAVLHISGRVTGAPSKDADIFVNGGAAGSVRVRPDGTFTLWRVPPGTHMLTAESMTHSGSRYSGAVEVVVGDASVDSVELALVPPFEIGGRIDGWVGGAGKLRLRPLGRSESEGLIADITAAGNFRVVVGQPGLYGVTIAGLPETTYIRRVRVATVDSPEGLLDVRAGDPHDAVSVELAIGAARVSGTVSDDSGPVPGALVALFPDGRHATERRILTTAGNDGKYSIGGVAPGKYAILALPALDPKALAQYDERLERLDLSEGDAILKDVKVTLR